MAKVLSCKDLGAACDWTVRADTEEELRERAAEHGAKAHGMAEITDEFWEKARAVIREE